MRRILTTLVLTALLLSVAIVKTNAQEMSDSCKMRISTYKEYALKKYYDDALAPWKLAFAECPKANYSLYTDGIKIYKHLIKKNKKDKEKVYKYVDTLMTIYDQWMVNFKDHKKYPEAHIIGLKGNDLFTYKNSDIEAVHIAYGYMGKSIEGRGVKALSAIISNYMIATKKLFKAKKIIAGDVVSNFVNAMDILEKQKKNAMKKADINEYYKFTADWDSLKTRISELTEEKKVAKEATKKKEISAGIKKITKDIKAFKKTKKYLYKLNLAETAIRNVEKIFTESGAASCENLTEIFTPKFNENKEDIDFLKKITSILDKSGCDDGQLFADASEKLYALDPSASAAYNIAKLYVKKAEYAKAAEYYQKAIDDEEDDLAKYRYYYQLAAVNMVLKKYSQVRVNAREAIKRDRANGKPYLLIAKAYASTSCGDNAVTRSGVYWAAVDKCAKARSVDPSVKGEANRLIGMYSSRFPNSEKAFMHNLSDGKSFRVGCWIQENTKVRTKK